MKKILILIMCAFGCFIFSNIYANPVNSFVPYVYVGGELGGAYSNWSDFTHINADNFTGVYGGKLGYQAARHFGTELGGFFVPKSNQNESVNNVTINGSVESWIGYGAATFRMPLIHSERLYLQGKVGPAYRSLEHDGQLYTGIGAGGYWSAILGTSLNYAFGAQNSFVVGIEYSHVFGSSDSWSSNGHINQDAAPSLQIVAATLSMRFKL